MERDLAEEGMLQLHGAVGVLRIRIGGAAASDCKNDRRNAGLRIKSMSNQRNPEESRTRMCAGCSARTFCTAENSTAWKNTYRKMRCKSTRV